MGTKALTRGFMILNSHATIGSYIFSQTCRSQTNSSWVGFLVACPFLGVIVSTVNALEVILLFFLGSTFIFIGNDLLYEWVSRQLNTVAPTDWLNGKRLKRNI